MSLQMQEIQNLPRDMLSKMTVMLQLVTVGASHRSSLHPYWSLPEKHLVACREAGSLRVERCNCNKKKKMKETKAVYGNQKL